MIRNIKIITTTIKMVCTYFLQCTQGVKDFPEKLKQCMQKKLHRQQ